MWLCPICGSRADSRHSFREFVFAQCRKCSFVSQVVPGSVETPGRTANYLREDYHAGYLSDQDAHLSRMKDFIAQLVKAAGRVRGVFCDLGCSVGLSLETAKRHGFTPLGIEINPATAEWARKRSDCQVLNWNVMEEWPTSLPEISVLFVNHVLEHFDSPFELLEKFNKSMPPGSLVWVNVPRLNSTKKALAKIGHFRTLALGEHVSWFNRRSLRFLMRRLGFDIVWEKGFYSKIRFPLAPLQVWSRIRRDPDAFAVIARRAGKGSEENT